MNGLLLLLKINLSERGFLSGSTYTFNCNKPADCIRLHESMKALMQHKCRIYQFIWLFKWLICPI